jgi:hypothetical protein
VLSLATAAIVGAAPPTLPKAKGLPAPKPGTGSAALPKPKLPSTLENVPLVVERTVDLRAGVQEFSSRGAHVRLSYGARAPGSSTSVRISRFDGGRRSASWIMPLGTDGRAPLPDALRSALSTLGGSYSVAVVSLQANRQLSDEAPLLSAAVGVPTVLRWKAPSPGLWRYFDQRRSPGRHGVDIDVELLGVRFLPSERYVVRWELDHVPPEVVVVKGAKPKLSTLRGDVGPGQATTWEAGQVTFSIRIPAALLPAEPLAGKEMSPQVTDRLLQHSSLRLSIIDTKTGRTIAGPEVANDWTGRPPAPPEPTTDRDGDGEDWTSYGGTDCDDDDPKIGVNQTERCDIDGFDEDCDPSTLGGPNDADRDGDGFVSWRCCNTRVSGSTECGIDCDDANPQINPHKQDICNGIDDDCDGQIDEDLLNCPPK